MCALGHCLTSEVRVVRYVKNGLLLLLVNNLRVYSEISISSVSARYRIAAAWFGA